MSNDILTLREVTDYLKSTEMTVYNLTQKRHRIKGRLALEVPERGYRHLDRYQDSGRGFLWGGKSATRVRTDQQWRPPRERAEEVMSLLDVLQPGVRLLDKQRGRERLVRGIERLGRIVKIWFDDPRTGGMEPLVYPVTEAEQRFEILKGSTAAFQSESEIVRLVAECHRLAHAYLFNPLFATETSLIDPLPHQLIAVCLPAQWRRSTQ